MRRCFDRPVGGYIFCCSYHDHDGGFCRLPEGTDCPSESIWRRCQQVGELNAEIADLRSMLKQAAERLVAYGKPVQTRNARQDYLLHVALGSPELMLSELRVKKLVESLREALK